MLLSSPWRPNALSGEQVIAHALWKPPLQEGEDQGDMGAQDIAARELLVTVYRSPASSTSPQSQSQMPRDDSRGTLDTDWGSLPEEAVTVLSSHEAEEWREGQRTLTRGHIDTILRLAKMSVSADSDVLLPMVRISSMNRKARDLLTLCHRPLGLAIFGG